MGRSDRRGSETAGLVQSPATQQNLLLGAIEHLAIGVAMSPGVGCEITMNAAARQLIDDPDWAAPAQAGLPPRRSAERLTLGQHLEKVVREQDGERHALTLLSESLQHRLHLFVEPLAGGGVVVFICDPHRRIDPSEAVLRELYQFTAAEAKLVCELVNGRTVEEAAEKLGIKLNTARSHLKKIFAKTHTQRQGEMVRLLTTSIAALNLKE